MPITQEFVTIALCRGRSAIIDGSGTSKDIRIARAGRTLTTYPEPKQYSPEPQDAVSLVHKAIVPESDFQMETDEVVKGG